MHRPFGMDVGERHKGRQQGGVLLLNCSHGLADGRHSVGGPRIEWWAIKGGKYLPVISPTPRLGYLFGSCEISMTEMLCRGATLHQDAGSKAAIELFPPFPYMLPSMLPSLAGWLRQRTGWPNMRAANDGDKMTGLATDARILALRRGNLTTSCRRACCVESQLAVQ
jgi:hypothetical protein